jgi:hypothetical protein
MASYPNHRTDHIFNYLNIDQKLSYSEMLTDLEYLVSVIKPKALSEAMEYGKER